MPRPWHLFGAALLAAALTSTALPAAVAATVPADEGATASPGQAGADQIQWPQGSFRALCGARQGAQPDRRTLRLAGGTQVEAVAAKVSRDRQGTLLWAGHVVGRPDLPVILAADNACGSGVPRVAGEVHLGTAEYTIDADQPGVSTVRRLPSHRQASLKDDIRRIAPRSAPRTAAQAASPRGRRSARHRSAHRLHTGDGSSHHGWCRGAGPEGEGVRGRGEQGICRQYGECPAQPGRDLRHPGVGRRRQGSGGHAERPVGPERRPVLQ